MVDAAFAITAFTTLFVIIDPLGLAPVFAALTQGMEGPRRRAVALRACTIGFGILLLFGVFGEAVLGFVGISLPAFRVAGGLLLFLTALDMLFERRTKRREDQAEDDEHEDPSVFPLATPLIAGPGAIATVILLSNQGDGGAAQTMVVLAITAAVIALAFCLFLVTGALERLLGQVGIVGLTRVFGMLLAALSVQFVLDGLADFGMVARL